MVSLNSVVNENMSASGASSNGKVTRQIFVTGGVASSLGKGLSASSLGQLLRSRGLSVTMQKFDPYLNVDPGTMNPFQHGEVFVTDDGAETDLDIGHYERFLDENLDQSANVTTGQVYSSVIAKERRGEYLGDTVQVIPHITNEIKARMRYAAEIDNAPDIIITEIGVILSPCHLWKPRGRCAAMWGVRTCFSCTSPWCRLLVHLASLKPNPPSIQSPLCGVWGFNLTD